MSPNCPNAPRGETAQDRREALITAGRARLRPILMSAGIAILTLMPLALGLGEGAGMQKPLAIAIIFGLLAGAPLVLVGLPAALALGSSLRLKTTRSGRFSP